MTGSFAQDDGALAPSYATVDVFEPLMEHPRLGRDWMLAIARTQPAAFISPAAAIEVATVTRLNGGTESLVDRLAVREATFGTDLADPAGFFHTDLAELAQGPLTILDRDFARRYMPAVHVVAWSAPCPNGRIIRFPPGMCPECECDRSKVTSRA